VEQTLVTASPEETASLGRRVAGQLDLAHEVWLALLDLIGQWIAVTRRPAHEDVRHEDIPAGQPDLRQQLVQ